MPKQTYHNLTNDKKERIFNAGVLEFSYHEVNDASVNTIVRIANISKGSFYQYFDDKQDFYWYIIIEMFFGRVRNYSESLKKNKGDIFLTEEELFNSILDMFDETKYHNLLTNVFKTSYMEFRTKISAKGSTIYFDMYDLLMEYGFKGYNIKSKEDFLIVFEMMRNITNNTIMTMISENLGKHATKVLYTKQMEMLGRGITRKGWF